MKTSNWIKLIGILCIVFGISGIFNNISPFLISEVNEKAGEMIETPQGRSIWFMINNYIGIFVPLFY